MAATNKKRITRLGREVRFLSRAAVGGGEEEAGRLGDAFDFIDPTDRFGQKTWELAEAEMARVALNIALRKAELSHEDIDLVISGDLQNQCVASSIGLESFGIPAITVYGACSTCTESLLLASALINVGAAERAATVTTSHNLAAERQFRAPTEYGSQRAPTAQWTATAGGAFILTAERGNDGYAVIEDFMVGRIIGSATTDGTNMGAAMSFAAAESILSYFAESEMRPQDFDLIVTGDLGAVGSSILSEVLEERLPAAAPRHRDCGLLLYDMKRQDAHSGASGCGTSAAVLAADILPKLESGELSEVLFLSTGALMSQSSLLQGNSIAGIAPAIHLSHRGKKETKA